MYQHPHEHLLAELRRLDLILLVYLEALRPATDAAKAELAEIKALLAPTGDERGKSPADSVDGALRRQIEAIGRDIRESRGRGQRLPILEACRNLDLDANALGVLIIACAPHLDRKYGRTFAFLQGGRNLTLPRVDLALDLFASSPAQRFELRRVFEPTAPLLRSGYLQLGGAGDNLEATPFLERTLQVAPRLIRYLLGHDAPDPIVHAMTPRGPLVPPTSGQIEAITQVARVWDVEERPGVVAIFVTDDAEGICSGFEKLAAERHVPFLAVDLARPSAIRTPIEPRVRESFREATLCGALLCVAGFQQLPETERELAGAEIAASLEGYPGACVLIGDLAQRLRRELRHRPVIEVRPAAPDTDERSDLWRVALAHLDRSGTISADELAWRYRLGSAEIQDAVHLAEADVRSLDGKWRETLPTALTRACRARSRRDLDALAQIIEPRGQWSDLILPEASIQQLQELVHHLKHHDLVFSTWGLRTKVLNSDGIASLFAGPPGTGKTMASALVARELGRELFRVDLATVVSKYIGETEKNLEKVFSAAHRSNAVLFFDEADALFGKRTEVKDAHDRYANVETGYLLQRIETFDGIVILATNFKKNVDEAFMRRMAVVVDFPMPEAAERRRLWVSLLPDTMPRTGDIDVDFLATRFELSGGHIKNAIQTAAMLAAEERPQSVRFVHLLLGVRRELRKLGRVIDGSDFGRYRDLLPENDRSGKALSGGKASTGDPAANAVASRQGRK